MSTRAGPLLLGQSASRPERGRVGHLLDRLLEYVRAVNEHARRFVHAAEEVQNAGAAEVEHMRVVLNTRRAPSSASRREDGDTARRVAFGRDPTNLTAAYSEASIMERFS